MIPNTTDTNISIWVCELIIVKLQTARKRQKCTEITRNKKLDKLEVTGETWSIPLSEGDKITLSYEVLYNRLEMKE